jgi:hypothetical protein
MRHNRAAATQDRGEKKSKIGLEKKGKKRVKKKEKEEGYERKMKNRGSSP